jgi:hypothetical protein
MLYDYADGKRKILFVYFYDSTATEYLAGTGRYMMWNFFEMIIVIPAWKDFFFCEVNAVISQLIFNSYLISRCLKENDGKWKKTSIMRTFHYHTLLSLPFNNCNLLSSQMPLRWKFCWSYFEIVSFVGTLRH